jgi:catechol 2,3-dioxygenase-like lactoylglutathione lyase family enzyme
MDILFVSGFGAIVADPAAGSAFYKDALGLPLETVAGDYIAVDGFEGAKHLGIWPLADAAQSCFGVPEWPEDIPVPQATIDFEVLDVQASATPPGTTRRRPFSIADVPCKGHWAIESAFRRFSIGEVPSEGNSAIEMRVGQ